MIWFVQNPDGSISGPMAWEQIQWLLGQGQISGQAWVAQEGQQWQRLNDLLGTASQGVVPKREIGFAFGLGLFLMPWIFAWFTYSRGYRNSLRVIATLWAAFTFLFAFVFIAAVGGAARKHGQATALASESREPTDKNSSRSRRRSPNPQPEPVTEPDDIELSGSGQQATPVFKLERGLSVFSLTHEGGNNFSALLLDGDGNRVALLVNDIGSFQGSSAVGIEAPGDHLLDISASGPWTVTVEQPRVVKGKPVPITLNGEGQMATDFVQLQSGLARFQLKHSGSENFSVKLLDKRGNLQDLLANEIGPFDGSKAARVRRTDQYLLDVQADGKWVIVIE